ncbi:MAG TPA: hypothetical protein VMW46_07345 [Candidatus Desulfaltia sp.]|nr:hypothetical protein [Candidatus Desulfaltia sp.]
MPTHTELFEARIATDQYQGNWLLGMNLEELLLAGVAADALDNLERHGDIWDRFMKKYKEIPGKIAVMKPAVGK